MDNSKTKEIKINMIERTDTNIHRNELLVVINYLLNNTDASHVASRQSICRYATKFGFRYDEKNMAGNDVRRDRVSDCLDYLFLLQHEHPGLLPFELCKTKKDKFYVGKRNNITFEQACEIIHSIRNSSFLADNEKKELETAIKDGLVSNINKGDIEECISKIGNKKYRLSSKAQYKLEILKEALNCDGIISLTLKHRRNSILEREKIWCRVYKIQELHGELYCYLIPLSNVVGSGVLAYKVKDVPITEGPKSEQIIHSDYSIRSTNDVFLQNHKYYKGRYKNIEEYLKDAKIPSPLFHPFLYHAFCQPSALDDIINSFMYYFGEKPEYKFATSFSTNNKSYSSWKDHDLIQAAGPITDINKVDDKNDATFVVIKFRCTVEALMEWLISDPFKLKKLYFTNESINEKLQDFYSTMANTYSRRYKSHNS